MGIGRLLACGATIGLIGGPAVAAGPGRVIGLVVTSWRPALYETQDLKECPAGFTPGESKQAVIADGAAELLRKFSWTENRGPNGEMARFSPTTVKDKLPFSELQTKAGFGFNLDGTTDGRATLKSVKHEKFTNPEGEQVDNQLARLLGCSKEWRTAGLTVEYTSMEIRDSAATRILVEISGVEDETNDSSVDVAIYKGADSELVPGPGGTFIPFRSQTVDTRQTRFMSRARGKIVNGVLTIDPVPYAAVPSVLIRVNSERRFRDLRLRLKLSEFGAEGLLGGYEDLTHWWNLYSKGAPGSGASFPSLYDAMLRHADGYPDPRTGKATAISSAYKVTAVRAVIIHPTAARGARIASTDSGKAE